LKLLRELLGENGVIFVSIDDNEQHRLRSLMDLSFGEDNFITNLIWEKKFSPQSDAKWFSDNHDFILVYAKNKLNWFPNLLPRTAKSKARYLNPDNDSRGPWTSADLTVKTYSADYDYPIQTPSGKKVYPTSGRSWSMPKENLAKLIADNRIWFGKNGGNVPRVKIFLTEAQKGIVPLTIWKHTEAGHTQQARQEIKVILEGSELFENPKPPLLIERILRVATQQSENDIVLDSFAGSGTTAHAVLALNKKDGGNRRFILVECEDYADKITAERVRRVIKGVPGAKDENLKNGLGGSFSYFELGAPIEMESILSGDNLPTYKELARYVFYTATGEEFDESVLDEKKNFAGESTNYLVYLFYKPDLEYLKKTALTLDRTKALGTYKKKRRLVFAPTKYLDQRHLDELRIDFAQLPFEIYQLVK
ncbi:MAG: site-specific DNA-methyltransferase, partial [Planctomycetes bacterium]|nr:site-specific DNA-methyltransferase [Planctomycetota bacterium]